MTNRLELNWKVDGFISEQRYYCSEAPIDIDNLPIPKVVLAGDTRTYIDTDIAAGKTYYVCMSSIRNSVEKFSDVIAVTAGVWKPEYLLPSIYFDSSDLIGLDGATVEGWQCRITGVTLTPTATRPTINESLGFKTCRFSQTVNLSSSDNALKSLMKAKQFGSVFIVFKKERIDTSSQSRRIFNITTPSSGARFAIYADDASSGNMNKLTVGGRRLDSNAYKSLATQNTVDLNVHFLFGGVDHTTAQLSLSLDGGDLVTSGTTQGTGETSNTDSAPFYLGGGAVTAGYDGHLAACVFIDRKLTTVERQKLEGWAAHKYGLTGNLPADHPYKTLVPTI